MSRYYGGGLLLARSWIRKARIIEADYYIKTDKTGESSVNVGTLTPRRGLVGKICDVRISVTRNSFSRNDILYSADARNIRDE